jgi:acetoin utilization deacetylase AcuC-like enzyme
MRTLLVHSLIEACGLLPHLDVVEECEVDRIDLTKFHSRSYVDFLRKPNTREQEEFGCDYDCPCFPQMWDYARAVVGGTLSGARKLIDGEARVAMHFNGGRHHAKPDRADGFCYINDICIAIFELLTLGPVLYIDIDCHHGDGVEQAFYSSNRVCEYSCLALCRRISCGR